MDLLNRMHKMSNVITITVVFLIMKLRALYDDREQRETQLQFYQSFFFYSPTDAQVNCLKSNFKIYIKINIKAAPTCFGVLTPSSGSALFVLAAVTVVKITN